MLAHCCALQYRKRMSVSLVIQKNATLHTMEYRKVTFEECWKIFVYSLLYYIIFQNTGLASDGFTGFSLSLASLFVPSLPPVSWSPGTWLQGSLVHAVLCQANVVWAVHATVVTPAGRPKWAVLLFRVEHTLEEETCFANFKLFFRMASMCQKAHWKLSLMCSEKQNLLNRCKVQETTTWLLLALVYPSSVFPRKFPRKGEQWLLHFMTDYIKVLVMHLQILSCTCNKTCGLYLSALLPPPLVLVTQKEASFFAQITK